MRALVLADAGERMSKANELIERVTRGAPKEMAVATDAEAKRFSKLVQVTAGCHIWNGTKNSQGYGQFRARGKMYRAHRVSLVLAGVRVPSDKEVDHTCKNTSCVNPAHLRVVRKIENWEASDCPSRINRDKNTCLRGHKLDASNTKINSNGQRTCRACTRIHYANSKRRKREAVDALARIRALLSRCPHDGCNCLDEIEKIAGEEK